MQEPSVRLNNAGVDCLEAGDHKLAWDFFKGSLEVKLAMERCGMENSADGSSRFSLEEAAASNVYIQRAEDHYLRLDEYLTSNRDGFGSERDAEDPETSSQLQTHGSSSQSDHYFYTPFLYSRPLRLQEPGIGASTRRDSATVIFNLAVVDHIRNRDSKQAIALYELAMTLLTGDPVDILGIALVNNIGVWCHENNDEEGAMGCMRNLAAFVRSCNLDLAQADREGLHSNIIFLLNPPLVASPAA